MNLENDECGEPKEKSCLPRLFLVLVFLIIFISLARRRAFRWGPLSRKKGDAFVFFFPKKNAASSRDGTPAEPPDHVCRRVRAAVRVLTFYQSSLGHLLVLYVMTIVRSGGGREIGTTHDR